MERSWFSLVVVLVVLPGLPTRDVLLLQQEVASYLLDTPLPFLIAVETVKH